jgi:hypothetical protein
VVVSNSDRNLKDTDRFLNAEPGIAVNPVSPRKIVISAFSGAWTTEGQAPPANAPIWYSKDGGRLWTKEFTIPSPPGVSRSAVNQSPCDQTFDYGRDGVLYGTFLLSGGGQEGGNCSTVGVTESQENSSDAVYTGGTTDPANQGAWSWRVTNGKTQPTTQMLADQPWVVVGKDPSRRWHENVYVGYQGSNSMQVAVAEAHLPLDFSVDHQSGLAVPFRGNPGQRIAADHRTGALYALHQEQGTADCSSALAVSYVLNRSLNGGVSWELNGNPDGISVSQVCSHQDLFSNLFGEPEPNTIAGGVNPLRGGIDALAVDSRSGAVYVVFGEYDAGVNRDRIGIVQVTPGHDESVQVQPAHFVSGTQHQSALPGVAVAENGAVGVLYDTADGLAEDSGRPYFSIHFALSRDDGKTFEDVVAQKFLFPEGAPAGNFGPRPLGDYQQLKSLGNVFYGVFSGDGKPFGRPFHKIDPIFLKTSAERGDE